MFLIVMLATACAETYTPSASTHNPETFYLGGIQVNEADYDRWAQTIDAAGMNTIEVTVYAKQGNWNTDHLWYDAENKGVVKEIKAAKAQGLHVILILRVALDHAFPENKFMWHGMIAPESDSLTSSWFAKYGAFVDQWATIAEGEHVDALVIGSEMNALSSTDSITTLPELINFYKSESLQLAWDRRVLQFEDELKTRHLWVRGFDNYEDPHAYIADRIAINKAWADQMGFEWEGNYLGKMNARRALLRKEWRALIRNTRAKFSGKLSYAANYDNYHEVAFWDDLDFIGINAYFPLRDPGASYSDTATLKSMLTQGWRKVLWEINTFREAQHLDSTDVLFTELGYIYRENCTIEPWKGFGFSVVGQLGEEQLIVWPEQPENRTERRLAVDALHTAVNDLNFPLKGILYWKLTTHDYHIPYEPFVLHIADEPQDDLQVALAQFLNDSTLHHNK